MNRARIIFYSIFGFYQLAAFVFTVMIDSSNTSTLLGLLKYLGLFKYITFLGLLLIITDFVWLWMDSRRIKKSEDTYRHENNLLKAKVYDLQEGAKPKEDLPRVNKAN